jgi:hypothetical protein
LINGVAAGEVAGRLLSTPGLLINVRKIRVEPDNLELSQTGVCPGDLFFRPQRNKPNSYSSYKTEERE